MYIFEDLNLLHDLNGSIIMARQIETRILLVFVRKNKLPFESTQKKSPFESIQRKLLFLTGIMRKENDKNCRPTCSISMETSLSERKINRHWRTRNF
jgi:predicted transposase YbfD/YdcC